MVGYAKYKKIQIIKSFLIFVLILCIFYSVQFLDFNARAFKNYKLYDIAEFILGINVILINFYYNMKEIVMVWLLGNTLIYYLGLYLNNTFHYS